MPVKCKWIWYFYQSTKVINQNTYKALYVSWCHLFIRIACMTCGRNTLTSEVCLLITKAGGCKLSLNKYQLNSVQHRTQQFYCVLFVEMLHYPLHHLFCLYITVAGRCRFIIYLLQSAINILLRDCQFWFGLNCHRRHCTIPPPLDGLMTLNWHYSH